MRNDNIKQGNEDLRKEITTLHELRFALAVTSKKYPKEYDEVLGALTEQ